MSSQHCLRALARRALRAGPELVRRAPLRQFSASAPAFPVPPADLPQSAGEPDSRAARAEALLSGGDPTEVASEVYALASAASAAGCARGRVIHGGLLAQGLGVAADAGLARGLFEQSAAAGDAWGMVALGQSLLEETDEAEDGARDLRDARVTLSDAGAKFEAADVKRQTPAEVVRASRKARRAAGFADHEGPAFQQSKIDAADAARAAQRAAARAWLCAAEARGLDAAPLVLGNAAAAERDFAEAARCYERAIAASKNPHAYFNLGRILEEGPDGVPQDPARSYKCLAMAAQLGDADAQAHLGRALSGGSPHREADPAAARTYIELAAAQMHPEGLFLLAGLHRAGQAGLEKSDAAYRRYLGLAADAGCPDAMAEMADLYYKGEVGFERDNKKALEWFERAGEAGHADAMCSAAAMHYHGRGTAVNKHKAMLTYQDAIVLNSKMAMRNLGAMYFHGDGIPKNLTLAEQFFQLADEEDKHEQEEAKKLDSMPIRNEPAPQHPMSLISQEIKNDV